MTPAVSLRVAVRDDDLGSIGVMESLPICQGDDRDNNRAFQYFFQVFLDQRPCRACTARDLKCKGGGGPTRKLATAGLSFCFFD